MSLFFYNIIMTYIYWTYALLLWTVYCYQRSCVPLPSTPCSCNFTCWNPNLQHLKCDYIWRQGLQSNKVRWGRVVFPYRRRLGHRLVCAQKDHVRTHREGSHLQAKGRGFRRNQTCQHLDLGLLASWTARK